VIDRATARLEHIAEAIKNIKVLLDGKSTIHLDTDPVTRAAFERFLEIISEASRRLPSDEKAHHPELPWSQIADRGNHLRHAYHKVDAGILWGIYLKDLDPLEIAIASMLRRRER
jgi:uncharacterized protein with HEPN domain